MKKIIILGFLSVFILTGCTLFDKKDGDVLGTKILSTEEAKAKATDFINNNLMGEGQKADVKEVVEENGLYKVVVNTGGTQDIESFMSKDGKTFFPQALDVDEVKSQTNQTQNETSAVAQVTNKNDKPKVELFIMSHCPYGTQIEKGILPVIETLGNKIDFELKFCDYAMHGEIEIKEQLNQYCIQKEQPEKLISYLKCFLEDSDGAGCLNTVGINKTKLKNCTDSADQQFKVTELLNDKSSWKGSFPKFTVDQASVNQYGVQGSPTLVVNGEQISVSRSPEAIKQVICKAFNKEPKACDTVLSTSQASPSFGAGTATQGAAADCEV